MNDIEHKTQAVRCFEPQTHAVMGGRGNILCFLRGDSIFIQCSDRYCRRWTRLLFRIPGVNVDFEQAAIIQKMLPEGYHFNAIPAKTIIEDA